MVASKWVFVGFLLTLAPPAASQDSHYWTSQFGNRARLLSGAVIGGVRDLSAVYYNPGALVLNDPPDLLLAGNVFAYSRLTVSDALGPGRDLLSTRFSLRPSLFAGEIRIDEEGNNRVAYAFLTRHEFEGRINDQAEITSLFPESDLAFSSAEVRLDTRLSEYWIGGSWARKLGEKVGIGVSPFLAVRNHRLRAQGLVQALEQNGSAGIGVLGRDFRYQDWRFLAKASLATEWERWQLGFTLTTPSLGLFGEGDTSLDRSTAVQGGGSEITTSYQNGPSADDRSPLSLGFGASRELGRTSFHFAAEWFDSADERTILDTEPFLSQSTGESLENDLVSARDSVLNVALGVEQKLRTDLEIYGGFHTDFSSVSSGNNSNDRITNWDLYHLSGGAKFPVAGSEMTLGGIVAFGSGLLGENEIGLDRELDVSFVRFTFIVGFEFSF